MKQQKSSKLKPAELYPKFCPSCGQQRLTKTEQHPLFTLIAYNGKQVQQYEQTQISIPYCLKCGFHWDLIPSPESLSAANSSQLTDLSNEALWAVIVKLYPVFKNLTSGTAESSGKSLNHVHQVIEGAKKSHLVSMEMAKEFRRRLLQQNISVRTAEKSPNQPA